MGSVSRRAFLEGLAAGAAVGFVGARSAAAADTTTLSNARILLGDGREVVGGVRVENGLVADVGPGVTGGVDLGGQVLWPGVWLGGSPIGLYEVGQEAGTHDDREGSDAVVPQVRAIDGYNPTSAVVEVARVAGLQGALLMPQGGLVSGRAAWVRLYGRTRGEATIAVDAGVVMHVGASGRGDAPNQPRSRMGVVARLRDLLEENAPPTADAGKKVKKKGEEPPTFTEAQRVWHALRRRETKALLHADRADDLLAAIELARAYNLDAVLVGAAEGHVVARELADAGHPVIVGPVTTQPSSFDTRYASYENAARLHRAGLRIAFRVPDPHMARDVTTEAGIAVAYGMPFEAAIAGLCSNAPKAWGLPHGVLGVGTEATFVHADGDPLQPRTRVLGVWQRGVRMPLTNRQTELYERWK